MFWVIHSHGIGNVSLSLEEHTCQIAFHDKDKLMSIFCIASDIWRDIGQKLKFFLNPHV